MGVFRKNGAWRIDYCVNGRRHREKIGTHKRLAEVILAKKRVQIIEGKYLDIVRDEKITFRNFANTFIETHAKVNKKSWESDVHRLKVLNPFFGDRYLYHVTTMDVEKYKAERIKTVKPATVNRELALLKVIFNKAVHWGILNRVNPVQRVSKLKENNERLRFLSKEEILKLCEHCKGEMLALVKFAVNTGMRRGEIMALTWGRIPLQTVN